MPSSNIMTAPRASCVLSLAFQISSGSPPEHTKTTPELFILLHKVQAKFWIYLATNRYPFPPSLKMAGFKLFGRKKTTEETKEQAVSGNIPVKAWDASKHQPAKGKHLTNAITTNLTYTPNAQDKDALVGYRYPQSKPERQLSPNSNDSANRSQAATDEVRRSQDAPDDASGDSDASTTRTNIYQEAKRRGSINLYQRKEIKRSGLLPGRITLSAKEELRCGLRLRWSEKPLFVSETKPASPRFSLIDSDEDEEEENIGVATVPFPFMKSKSDSLSESDYEHVDKDDDLDPLSTPELPPGLPQVQEVAKVSGVLVRVEDCVGLVAEAQSAVFDDDAEDEDGRAMVLQPALRLEGPNPKTVHENDEENEWVDLR